MFIWSAHFNGTVSVPSIAVPVLLGLTDGVAATGSMLTVQVDGAVPTDPIQWLLDGLPLSGAVSDRLAVPAQPGAQISVTVGGVQSAAVVIVQTYLVAFQFPGAVLNPGDLVSLTRDGAPAPLGTVDLTRDGAPLSLVNGQYTVTAADLGAALRARQSDLPSNQSTAVSVVPPPPPVLSSGPSYTGQTAEGASLAIALNDEWQTDGAIAGIAARNYRLVLAGDAGASQASPVLEIPDETAGQVAQPQIRARTATSAFSDWSNIGPAFTISAGTGWQIADLGDGTFSVISAPAPAAAPVITDRGDGSFDIAA